MDQSWMPREKWDSLVRGKDCPLCAYLSSEDGEWEYGYTVTDLESGRLFLHRNQYIRGYCVLVYQRHVREPFELAVQERQAFFEDMLRVSQVLEKMYKAIKMNFEILGNSVPHLHCHIKPRYYGDPAPGRTIDPNADSVILSKEEYQKRINSLYIELVKS